MGDVGDGGVEARGAVEACMTTAMRVMRETERGSESERRAALKR